jgi:hypothetical protein
MMNTRDRRAMLLGAGIIMPAVLFALVLKPHINAARELHAAIRQQRSQLARDLGLIEAARAGTLNSARRSAVQTVERQLLVASDATLLYARATAYVHELARLAQVTVEEAVSASADSLQDGLRAQVLSIRGSGDVTAVLSFVRMIEEGPAASRIERLQLVPRRDERDPPLTFALDVRLYGGSSLR